MERFLATYTSSVKEGNSTRPLMCERAAPLGSQKRVARIYRRCFHKNSNYGCNVILGESKKSYKFAKVAEVVIVSRVFLVLSCRVTEARTLGPDHSPQPHSWLS